MRFAIASGPADLLCALRHTWSDPIAPAKRKCASQNIAPRQLQRGGRFVAVLVEHTPSPRGQELLASRAILSCAPIPIHTTFAGSRSYQGMTDYKRSDYGNVQPIDETAARTPSFIAIWRCL